MFAGARHKWVRRKPWLFDFPADSRCSAPTYLPSMGGLFQRHLNGSKHEPRRLHPAQNTTAKQGSRPPLQITKGRFNQPGVREERGCRGHLLCHLSQRVSPQHCPWDEEWRVAGASAPTPEESQGSCRLCRGRVLNTVIGVKTILEEIKMK